MNMKGWLIMKYIIEIHTDCIESWKNAIGAPGYHGECIQKIIECDAESDKRVFACCTGTLRSYWDSKKFFGKNRVQNLSLFCRAKNTCSFMNRGIE